MSAVLSSSLFNCHRKIPICLVTFYLLTLKISTRIIVQCVIYVKNMLWICSPQNFVISAKWFLFVSRRRSKGFSFQENQTSEVVGDLSRLFLPRLTLRGGNPKTSQESGLNALAEGEKRERPASAKGRVIGHARLKKQSSDVKFVQISHELIGWMVLILWQ